jgi:hypothetical protein
MALRIKIDPVERFTQVTIRKDLSDAAKGRDIAAFVRDGIAEGDAVNQRVLGRIPPRTIMVDGRQNAPLESVNPDDGNIVVEWELVTDLLVWIGMELVARSPRRSGRFRQSWTLFADGTEVPLSGTIPPATKYVFVNLQPYARKIEIGKTQSGRSFVIQVPNRIAERTAKDARGRFGNQAKIMFGYESVSSGGAISAWARGSRSRRSNEWLTRQPAVIVYPKER